MSSPSSANVLIGRGIVLFAPRKNNVLQGYRDLGNCDVFSLLPASEFAELANYRTASTAPYKRVSKKTSLGIKLAGYEFDPSIISMLLLAEESVYTQAGGAVTGEVLALATVVGLKGTSFQVQSRSISAVTVRQGATVLALFNPVTQVGDYEITNAAGGVIRIVPTSATVVDGTALTIDYTAAAIAAGAAALPVISPAKNAAVEGRLLFLPDSATGPKLEHVYWNASISPDGEMGFIAEEFAKWGASVSLNDDSAGVYGGSLAFPFGKITQVAPGA